MQEIVVLLENVNSNDSAWECTRAPIYDIFSKILGELENQMIKPVREISTYLMIASKEKEIFIEQEECEFEQFLDLEIMKSIGTKPFSECTEFSDKKGCESCHEDEDGNFHEEIED